MADTLTTAWASPACRRLTPSVGVLLVSMAMRRLLHPIVINRLFVDSPHIYVVRKVTWYAVVRFPSAQPQGRPALARNPPD